MAEELKERKYKYKVPEDVFIKIFNETLSKSDLDSLKNFGIELLRGSYLKKKTSLLYQNKIEQHANYKIRDDFYYFLIFNSEVLLYGKEWITIESIQKLDKEVIFIDSKIPNLSIQNCKTIKFIGTSDIEIFSSIIIIDSIINSISIVNSKIGDITSFGSNIGDIKISNKSIIGKFTIFQTTINHFKIKGSTIPDIRIENCNTGNLDFYGSTIGDVDIFDSNTGNIEVYHSSMENLWSDGSYIGCIEIYKSKTGSFTIDGSIVYEFSVIDSITDFLKFTENSFSNEFSFENSTSSLWDINAAFASFTFNKAIIGYCNLNNCNIISLRIENSCKMEFYMKEGNVNYISFEKITLGKDSIISFSNVYFYACIIQEFSLLGNLYFRNINQLNHPMPFGAGKQLFRLKENGKTNLESLKYDYNKYSTHLKKLNFEYRLFQPTFRISQSSLGKTEFTECDFASFNFEYNNSKITEVFISGGTIPDKVHIPNETQPVKILEQEKSFFNQLKKYLKGREILYEVLSTMLAHQKFKCKLLKQKKEKGGLNILMPNGGYIS